MTKKFLFAKNEVTVAAGNFFDEEFFNGVIAFCNEHHLEFVRFVFGYVPMTINRNDRFQEVNAHFEWANREMRNRHQAEFDARHGKS